MELLQALSILSKSSPFAVSTERAEEDAQLSTYKNYIYIQTDIEQDFKKSLLKSGNHDIVFLCGSSGDGKSEILTRYSRDYRSTKDFHLDATHAFVPSQTAIQALDEKFTQFKANSKPLIIGINIGMLGNYAEEGADEHQDIKDSIKAFLSNEVESIPYNHTYLDFEKYPKFCFEDNVGKSDFTELFLQRLTEPDLKNPFYALYSYELQKKTNSRLLTNFALLSNPSVQRTIVELLLKARLIKDQFLTARALLDFVFQIVAMDGYLFDNLFTATNNEILEQIRSFDPSANHTKHIDEFILEFSLGMENSSYAELKTKLNTFGIFDIPTPKSMLRALYVLKSDDDFLNEFSSKLIEDFDNQLVDRYAYVWSLHDGFNANQEYRRELNHFYRDVLVPAIHRYCNRNSPNLDKDAYFVNEFNEFKVAVELDVRADFTQLKLQPKAKIGVFNAFLQINSKPIKPVAININLFELLEKINQGYRPNKHDKNAVLQLEDVVEQIVAISTEEGTLHIFSSENKYKITNEDGEYFEVSGI
ncbi:DNA phosphorothioation-dependent restriction protein DptF [Vibrio viridaestus]|uniref:DNA phosphorothioation-dependent restriction protein DptF n=1 Tax=Vibrio viridaestus TaxID=2487322 RepID=A0A3N9TES9_9VIBR|nr:DNA phosphorothioation-dependent restriction protein DptF [Vibrio viridaestus]RQW62374.1 DNA phosphorothioation-dependent restriction protein DptF [Vibrio viridaestus]